jgi:hypothetical protein
MPAQAAAQKAPAPAPQAPISRLAKIQKGRLRFPLRFVIYGPEGVGKSTLAAASPNPIWLDIEDGSSRLNVARYQFRDDASGHVPNNYAEVISAIDDLGMNDHPFETLVIDTADRLESLIWKFMMERDKKTSIEDYGFGKGFNLAVDEWRALCVRLDRLRSVRRMSVILLAHAQIRTFKNPDGEDYDRYNLRINEKAGGFLKEWSDVAGFACFEEGAAKQIGDKNGRPKGFSTGRRLLKVARTAAFDAKSRIDLPAEVEMDLANPWGPLAAAVEAGYENELDKLASAIAAELARIGDDALAPKVEAATKEAVAKGDATSLSRYLADMKKRPSKSNQ